MRALAGIKGPKSTCLRSTGKSCWSNGYKRANCKGLAKVTFGSESSLHAEDLLLHTFCLTKGAWA